MYDNVLYDIVYSLPVHEDIASVIDLIYNIQHFNKNVKSLIILHTNEAISNAIIKHNSIFPKDNVIVNPSVYAASTFNYKILKKHIDNFEYLLSLNIDFKVFMTLASNCLFIKEPNKNFLNSIVNIPINITESDDIYKYTHDPADIHWTTILSNVKIKEQFEKYNIAYVINQIECWYVSKNNMIEILKLFKKLNIDNSIEVETVFEEFIPGSLLYYCTGTKDIKLCKNSLNNIDFTEDEINDTIQNDPNSWCMKRFKREYTNPIRTYVRESNNKYDKPLINLIESFTNFTKNNNIRQVRDLIKLDKLYISIFFLLWISIYYFIIHYYI
jgi:hypothetical protein